MILLSKKPAHDMLMETVFKILLHNFISYVNISSELTKVFLCC